MKQRFMLDTNAVRMLLERRSPQLDQWFAEERCSLSAIVAAEIRFGLARRRLPERRAALVCDLLEVLPVRPSMSRWRRPTADCGLSSSGLASLWRRWTF